MHIREQHEIILRIFTYSSLAALGIAIIVVTILLVSPDNNDDTDECQVPDPPPNIWFTQSDNNTLKVSWITNLIDRNCNVTYYLMFSYGGRKWNYQTSEDLVILENMYECSLFTAHIWSVSKWMQMSTYHTEDYLDIKPTTVSDVQNIVVIPSSPGMITVTWDQPPNVSECDVVYTVTTSSPDNSKDQVHCDKLSSRSCTFREYCNTTTNTVDVRILIRIEGTAVQGSTSSSHDCFF